MSLDLFKSENLSQGHCPSRPKYDFKIGNLVRERLRGRKTGKISMQLSFEWPVSSQKSIFQMFCRKKESEQWKKCLISGGWGFRLELKHAEYCFHFFYEPFDYDDDVYIFYSLTLVSIMLLFVIFRCVSFSSSYLGE